MTKLVTAAARSETPTSPTINRNQMDCCGPPGFGGFSAGARMLSRRRIGEHIPSSAQRVDVHVGVGILHALAYAMNKDFDRVRSDLLPVTINRLFDGGFRHYPIGTPEQQFEYAKFSAP